MDGLVSAAALWHHRLMNSAKLSTLVPTPAAVPTPTPTHGHIFAAAAVSAFLACLIVASEARTALAEDIIVDLGRGPLTVTVPSSYEPGAPLPLVLALHGYGGNGASMQSYWQLPTIAESRGFFVVHPEGTIDNNGNRFWNATDACCNFFGSTVDDSQYLLDLITEISSQVDVDPDRVYFCGHSNGGFMSHRMACDHPETVAAIASLAGAVWDDPIQCNPGSSVHVLQIHGTADNVIFYDGGNIFGNTYPSAVESVEYWAGVGGCSLTPDTSSPPLDLVNSLSGAETIVTKYEDGCDASGSGELWTILDGSHSPSFNSSFREELVDYFFEHPKPAAAEVTANSGNGIAALTCFPSPFAEGTTFQLQLSVETDLSIHVVSADGRLVRSITEAQRLDPGVHSFSWDGLDDANRPSASGVYFVRASGRGFNESVRVVRIAD